MTAFAIALLMFAASTPPPPGELIDAGGYKLHLNCTGTGSPTIILIGGFSFEWERVQRDIAEHNRVCSYDPAGNAWSNPSTIHTCEARVGELYRILTNAGVEPPFVLTGFSTGALYARLLAKEHPADIAAIVLIDHAFIPKAAPAGPAPAGLDSPPSVISMTAIQFSLEDEPGFDRLPYETRDLYRWAMSRNPDLPTADLAEECTSAIGPTKLGSIPLVVVSTANDTRGYAELQQQLLSLSSSSRQMIAGLSFHSVEISQPEVAIKAIELALKASTK